MKTTKLLQIVGLCALSTLLFTGCVKPPRVPDLVQVQPNETAWLIPLDGAAQDGQVKFDSVAFLNTKKIATKRVSIDKTWRPTGYGWQWWAGEWIQVARLITVDRRLITREWVDNIQTEGVDEGIPVNTQDNIKLTLGVTLTLSINEDDASTYLYFHGQRPLIEVADQNVRSYITAELNRQISGMSLTEFQNGQAKIYELLFKETAAIFKTKGITIEYLGNAKGWHFTNKEIQDSINRTFVSQQDNKTAHNEQDAQKTRNETLIFNAEAQRKAAQALYDAKEASMFNNDMKIKMMVAEARLAMSQKWDGKLPSNILPEGSSLIMDMSGK
jgi:hypothetical protein